MAILWLQGCIREIDTDSFWGSFGGMFCLKKWPRTDERSWFGSILYMAVTAGLLFVFGEGLRATIQKDDFGDFDYLQMSMFKELKKQPHHLKITL